MANIIGPEGEIILDSEIRERLGVGPGWTAVQQLVDDHVELRFIAPAETGSFKERAKAKDWAERTARIKANAKDIPAPGGTE